LGKPENTCYQKLDWAKKSLEYIKKAEQQHESTLNDLHKIDRSEAKTIIINELSEIRLWLQLCLYKKSKGPILKQFVFNYIV